MKPRATHRIKPLTLGVIAALALVVASLPWYWQVFHGDDDARGAPGGRHLAGLVDLPPAPFGPVPPAAGSSSGGEEGASPEPTPVEVNDPLLAAIEQQMENPGAVPGEIVLRFSNLGSMQRFQKDAARAGIAILGAVDGLKALRVRVTDAATLRDLLASLPGEKPDIEANLWVSIPPPPPQPDLNNQAGTTPYGRGGAVLDAIGATGNRSHWGDGVTVAVLDTGILDHPTFQVGQVTHVDLLKDGSPFNSHGTSVASLIGGQDPEAPGVAPGVHLLDVRVADSNGYSVSTLLAQGILEAVNRGAQVLNISLGSYGDSNLLREAVAYAQLHGAIVVAAAGNESYSELAFPAAYNPVISVGSVDAAGKQAWFSNSGNGLDLVAPGVGVVTAWGTDQLALASGTSQSTGLVSGAAAAYLYWGISPNNLAFRLRSDAKPTGAPTTQVGGGVLHIQPPAGKN